jgi:hypothetical protein
MIEKHLSVANTYRVARHHWPEQLIMKNKNESRKINVLIYRTEAILYGNQFVERLNMLADVNDVLAKMYDQQNKNLPIKMWPTSQLDHDPSLSPMYYQPF